MPVAGIAQGTLITARPDFQNQLYLATPTNAPVTSLAQPASISLFTGSVGVAGDVRTPNDGVVNLVQTGIGQAMFAAASELTAPSILLPLGNPVFFAHSNAAITITASGTEPVSYQWFRNRAAIAGATSATLSFPAIQPTNIGNYTAVISNSLGTVTSAVSAVSVIPQGLDTTFGNGGKVITSIGLFGGVAYGVAVLPDGRIVATGYTYNGTDHDIVVARYLPDGNLDTNFNGTGYVTTAVGNSSDYGHALAIQPDGKIVVAGRTDNTNGGGSSDFCVVRYLPDGALDTDFGGTGIVITDFNATDEPAYAVAVQPDGKIVAAGFGINTSNGNGFIALSRYELNGSLDSSFGGTGKIVSFPYQLTGIRSVALQNDGKIVVVGSVLNSTFATRYNADGSLDTSFNGTGIVRGGSAAEGKSVVIQRDGKILVGGAALVGGQYRDFALVRYDSNGSLDQSFGGTGEVTTGLQFVEDDAYSVALQADGRILLAGYESAGGYSNVKIVRYQTDGNLDLEFNETGSLTFNFGGYSYGRSIAVLSDGKIVIAGNGSGGFALARIESSEPLSPVPPSIFDQPENRLAYWGVGVAFSVTASGPFLSYQ